MPELEPVVAAPLHTKLPPGPRSSLLLTLGYMRSPADVVNRLAERYGDPFSVAMLGSRGVVTGDPEGVREMFSAPDGTFESPLTEQMEPMLGRHSVLLSSGEPHRASRKLLQPPFHGARIGAMAASMWATAQRHLAALASGQTLRAQELTQAISLDVIALTVMGFSGDAELAAARLAVDKFLRVNPIVIATPILRRTWGGFGPWASFLRTRERLHSLLRASIAARRQSPGGSDVLSLLVETKHEDGAPLDDRELIDHLVTLLVAGHETTATALAWGAFEVFRHPEVLARLRAELATAPRADAVALTQLPYLTAVCQEILRFHPLAPLINRRLLRPFVLRGVQLAPGQTASAALSIIHRNPAIYPEPHRFHPDRFLGRTYGPFEYFPFGGGHRRCLGAAFAMVEIKLVLAALASVRPLELLDTEVKAQVRLATVGPKGGVRMRVG